MRLAIKERKFSAKLISKVVTEFDSIQTSFVSFSFPHNYFSQILQFCHPSLYVGAYVRKYLEPNSLDNAKLSSLLPLYIANPLRLKEKVFSNITNVRIH